jgi:hypothetical protein
MKKDDLEYIVANHKWRFTARDIWDRYYIMLFPAFLFFISIGMPFGIGFVKPVIIFSLFLLPFSLYFFNDIMKRIKVERTFYYIESAVCQKAIIEDCVMELGWKTIDSSEQYIQACTKSSWTSWGEIITIIFLENRILFNSRPDIQPFTGNRDNVNFLELVEIITAKERGLLQTERR